MNKVILFTGGLDSFVAWKLLTNHGEEWQRVYFDLRSRYSVKEMAPMPPDVKRYETLNLWQLEQEDAFIPQRNALLITLAQALTDADEIVLNAVAGEFSRDKTAAFFQQMSSLLSYTADKSVRVFSPLAGGTKSQAVKRYLDAGFPADELLKTVSCYSAYKVACGECNSCVRAWVALELNGLADQRTWDSPPWEWIRTNRGPMRNLAHLPKAQWKDFSLNQLDLLKALWKVKRRLG